MPRRVAAVALLLGLVLVGPQAFASPRAECLGPYPGPPHELPEVGCFVYRLDHRPTLGELANNGGRWGVPTNKATVTVRPDGEGLFIVTFRWTRRISG